MRLMLFVLTKRLFLPLLLLQVSLGVSSAYSATHVKEIAALEGPSEGPVVDRLGNIYFSDLYNNKIYKYSSGGKLTIYIEESGGSNGLVFDNKDRLIVCEQGNKRITRRENNGSITVLADSFEGQAFNGPNDAVAAQDGSIYFTDPYFGRRLGITVPPVGVYRIGPQGGITRIIDHLKAPNGIGLSPDEQSLYVNDTGGLGVFIYVLNKDGTVQPGKRRLAVIRSPDGMAVDKNGNLYIASWGQSKVVAVSPGGEKIGEISIPVHDVTNCEISQKSHTLYVTGGGKLFELDLNSFWDKR